MRSELRREILNEVKNNVIKDVINDLDVFGCVYELNNEQNRDIDIITQKLCLVVEELESIVTNTVNESVNIAKQEMYVDDTSENIYSALVNSVLNCSDTTIMNDEKEIIGQGIVLDDNYSLVYYSSSDQLILFEDNKEILEIKKESNLLVNLLDLIDEGMRGE